ncbi:hypothetical protein [Komagataeibacter xylinus]|uniref:Uncharacterized protein n=1 Tax=Komagataeibacter xylinus TaxID=28448 RepID=A0A857FP97_KOMXY|nr:hypothetical protein [Komagataeibacter xylinus]QHC35339.1 hypothetical protein FMA36_07365 [Komagataeibacter xylinus]
MTFALILNGTVVQVSDTQFPVAPSLTWADISSASPQPAVGWTAEKSSAGTWSFAAPAAAVAPLKTQAASAQAWIQQQANLAAAMGETFTADMKAYVTAISAIASGTDTTSTVLPAQPTDVMTASTAAATT